MKRFFRTLIKASINAVIVSMFAIYFSSIAIFIFLIWAEPISADFVFRVVSFVCTGLGILALITFADKHLNRGN